MSQTDVAKQIGATPALISAYEKLERKLSIDKMISLVDVFHVSTDYILGRTVKDDSTAVIYIDGLSENQVKNYQRVNSGTEEMMCHTILIRCADASLQQQNFSVSKTLFYFIV